MSSRRRSDWAGAQATRDRGFDPFADADEDRGNGRAVERAPQRWTLLALGDRFRHNELALCGLKFSDPPFALLPP